MGLSHPDDAGPGRLVVVKHGWPPGCGLRLMLNLRALRSCRTSAQTLSNPYATSYGAAIWRNLPRGMADSPDILHVRLATDSDASIQAKSIHRLVSNVRYDVVQQELNRKGPYYLK